MGKVHPEDPKDLKNDRVPGFTYAWMIPYITRIARRHGYAIGVHGSMSRDLDLIAVPWVDDANEPEVLIEEIARLTGGGIVSDVKDSPHGRRAWNITFNGAWHFLDISVMPKSDSALRAENEQLRAERGEAIQKLRSIGIYHPNGTLMEYAESAFSIAQSLRAHIADPPPDIQEAVLDKLGLRQVYTERDRLRAALEECVKYLVGSGSRPNLLDLHAALATEPTPEQAERSAK